MFIVKNCWGTPVPDRVCASKPWSFSNACKNLRGSTPLGAEIWSSAKVDLDGSKLTCPTLLLVDLSSPDFFRRTREGSLSIACFFPILDIFIRSGDIRDQTEVVRNRAEFCTYWLLYFWEGPSPSELWDLDYKAQPASDHATKFHGDRSRELGDLALKNK